MNYYLTPSLDFQDGIFRVASSKMAVRVPGLAKRNSGLELANAFSVKLRRDSGNAAVPNATS
jgi:hypothetical protein